MRRLLTNVPAHPPTHSHFRRTRKALASLKVFNAVVAEENGQAGRVSRLGWLACWAGWQAGRGCRQGLPGWLAGQMLRAWWVGGQGGWVAVWFGRQGCQCSRETEVLNKEVSGAKKWAYVGF